LSMFKRKPCSLERHIYKKVKLKDVMAGFLMFGTLLAGYFIKATLAKALIRTRKCLIGYTHSRILRS